MPTIAEQISKKSTTPSNNIAEALVGFGGGDSSESGGGVFVINMVTNEDGTEHRLSKTAEEIIEAIYEGLLPVLFKRDNPLETDVWYLYNALYGIGANPCSFYFVAVTGSPTLELSRMVCTAENGSDYPLWNQVVEVPISQ